MKRMFLRIGRAAALLAVAALTSCGDDAKPQDSDAEPSTTTSSTDQNEKQAAASPETPGAGLYRVHCSGCHGIDGDGNGETELDRRPRDFVAGGFAFGNSREQLMKTISAGLPGDNPMPGFAEKMNEDEMGLVIDHILALGPQRREISRAERLLAVAERPVIVRGHLGSVSEDGPEHARGMLLGFPHGITLEYRADDLRLLAVRRGEFVDRVDWSGRGGQKLDPLGDVVQLINDGDDYAPWSLIEEEQRHALEAKLRATEVKGDAVALEFDLLHEGNVVLDGVVLVRVVPQSGGTTLSQEFVLEPRRNFRIAFRDGEKDAFELDATAGTVLETTLGKAILATKVADDSGKDD